MAGYGLVNREVVRVKVKKCDGLLQPEYKKFSVDPQITSFEMLQKLLARAFNISSDFTISYLAKGDSGQSVYLSMLSDWDMDASFQTASDPYLKLKVDLRPFDDGLDDWDIIAPVDIPHHRFSSLIEKSSLLNSITGTISSQVEKTVSHMQKAMGLKSEDSAIYKPVKPPMSDSEFHHYLDSDGRLVRPEEFRLSIYQGGVEPALRRVVWRHMLNIFPENLTGRERFDYIKSKELDYYGLRDEWKTRYSNGNINEELRFVTSMVKKDVLRTDRTHKFYAGSDDNKNIVSLFHILVTYAITHPEISYCQGMSDLASPLLVIQKDEAQAYLCFCGVMRRLRRNFTSDGTAITTKLQHLQDLLQIHDPVFFVYLRDCSAQDLFFCYRWLLLEVKREFPFEDALYMLEVMWSTLPPEPPEHDLPLMDPEFSPVILSPSPVPHPFSSKKSVYAKLLAIRRQTSIAKGKTKMTVLKQKSEMSQLLADNSVNNNSEVTNNDLSPGDEDKYITASLDDFPIGDDPMTRSLRSKSTSIDMSLEPTGLLPRQNGFKESIEEVCPVCQDDTNVESLPEDLEDNHHYGRDATEDKDGSADEVDSAKQHIDDPDSCNSNEVDNNLEEMANGDTHSNPVDILSENSNINSVNQGKGLPVNVKPTFRNHAPLARKRPEKIHLAQPGPPVLQEVDLDVQIMENNSAAGVANCIPAVTIDHCPNDTSDNASARNVEDRDTCTINGMKPSGCTMPRNGQNQALNKLKASGGLHISDCVEASELMTPESPDQSSMEFIRITERVPTLPCPLEFGWGNPFLMFVCLSLLLQHRDHILRNRMDYDELAMHFDKMVRKHNVYRVLYQARSLYSEYLREQQKLLLQQETAEAEEPDFSV